MVGLLDIAPLKEEVTLSSGQNVSISGVNARGIINILSRFPEVRMLLTGKEVSQQDWLKLAPDAIDAIIASGLGAVGDKDVEAQAGLLPLEDQMNIIAAVWKATLPNGVGPFAASLKRMGILEAIEGFGKGQATTSQPRLKN